MRVEVDSERLYDRDLHFDRPLTTERGIIIQQARLHEPVSVQMKAVLLGSLEEQCIAQLIAPIR